MADQFNLGTVADGVGGKEQKDRPERGEQLLSAPQIERRMRELLEMAGGAVEGLGDDYCGGIIAARAPALATAYSKLAQRNRAVRRLLSRLLTGSDWAEVLVLTLGTAVPIAAHHGWVPPEVAAPFTLGIVVPPPSDEVADHRRAAEAQPAEGYPAAPEPEPDRGHVAKAVPRSDAGDGDGSPPSP